MERSAVHLASQGKGRTSWSQYSGFDVREKQTSVLSSHWYLGLSVLKIKIILTYKSYFNFYLPGLLCSIKMLPSSKITESSFKPTYELFKNY